MKTFLDNVIAADKWGHRHTVLVFAALSLFGFMAFSQLFLSTSETHAEEPVFWCMDPSASNYDPLADTDDGSCIPYGCTQLRAENYNPIAIDDDGSCMLWGCMDPIANNYDPSATYDNAMCEYTYGCMQSWAENYDPSATMDDGSCYLYGCMDPTANNYDPNVTNDDASCTYNYGCTQGWAENYDPAATMDDSSCMLWWCTDMVDTTNYDPNATYDNGSCIYYVRWCTDPLANNYDSLATQNDGTCEYDIFWCMDPMAHNYSSVVTTDDNSCVYRDLDPQTFCSAYEPLLSIPVLECEALVDFYTATNGDSWLHNEGWFASEDICSSWYGVTCDDNANNVVWLWYIHNNLVWMIPTTIDNLTQLNSLALMYNTLYGDIPSSLANLTEIQTLALWFNVFNTNLDVWLTQLVNDIGPSMSTPFVGLDVTDVIYQTQASPAMMTTDLGTWCMDNAHLFTWGTALDCLALSDIYYAMSGVNRYHTDGWFTDTNIAQWYGINSNGFAFSQLLNFGGINLNEVGENVWHLMLTDNNLQWSFPASIQFIFGLGSLSLHNNAITSLPEEIGNVFGLNTLFVGNNLLTQLPESLGNLDLLMLSLGDNPRWIIGQMIDGIFWLFFTRQSLSPWNIWIEQLFWWGSFIPAQYINAISALFSLSREDVLASLQNIFGGGVMLDENYVHDGELLTSLHSSVILDFLRLIIDIAYQNGGNNPFNQIYQMFYQYYWVDWGFSESNYNNIIDLPASFANLDTLYMLDLSANQLEIIPEEVFDLEKLTYLNLSNNSLSEIPEDIENIQSLKILYISKNNITTLPTVFHNMPNFYNLNIHKNEIADFSPLVGSNISSLSLGRWSMAQLPLSITDITTLNKLSIEGGYLTQIPEEIGNLNNLYRLTVTNSQLSTAEGTLPTALTDLAFLRDLWLWGNQFVTLTSELLDTDALLRLDLSNNPLCWLTMQELDYLNAIPIAHWSESCPGQWCMDPLANNYDPAATIDNGMCTYDEYGCMDPSANNYDPSATIDNGMCTYDVYGCMDPIANNYNPSANIDNSMCEYNYGCTDPLADNYDQNATMDNGTCEYDGWRDGDPTTWCSAFQQDIIGLSIQECEALVDLYVATDGSQWSNTLNMQNQWLTSTTICTNESDQWRYGVYCNDDGVSHISLGSNNIIGAIPESFGNLIHLMGLDIVNNQISSLPSTFGNLDKLESIYAHGNQLTTLPDSIGDLNVLEYVDFSRNILQSLPDNFTNLITLQSAEFCGNQLTSLPSTFGNLSNLIYLSFWCKQWNLLTSLPNSFRNLSNLQYLYLTNNLFEQLPDRIGELNALTTLHVGNNQLDTFPSSIGDLVNLQYFDAWSNQLSQLPWTFVGLVSLIHLSVENNLLEALDVSNFSQLQELYAATNSLETIVLWSNANLVRLLLNNNVLLNIDLSGTPNIQDLNVAENRLTHLTLWLLRNIQQLDMSYNEIIGRIPSYITSQQYLQWFFANNNCLDIDWTSSEVIQFIENLPAWYNYTPQNENCPPIQEDITRDGDNFVVSEPRIVVPTVPWIDDVVIQIDGQDYPAIYDEDNNLWYVDIELSNGEYDVSVIYMYNGEIVDFYELTILVNTQWNGNSYCGDGIRDLPGEQCDNGPGNGQVPPLGQYPPYGASWSISYCTQQCTNAIISYQWWYCGDNTVNGPEQCDGTTNCNSNCTLKSSWSRDRQPNITIDYCPDWDFSPSYYDNDCGTGPKKPQHGSADDNEEKTHLIDNNIEFNKEVAKVTKAMQCNIRNELVQAYTFAFDLRITTVNNICNANLQWDITREEFAKFISTYAIAVLGKKPDTTRRCVFNDISTTTTEMQTFARISCELGIMGLKQNGDPDSTFRPKDSVPRTEVFTALNRLVNGDIDNSVTGVRYIKHMNRLLQQRVIFDTTSPQRKALRWDILLMLMRAYTVIKNIDR